MKKGGSYEPPLVRVMGLEPIRYSTHAPQTCLSASSSTLAYQAVTYDFDIIAPTKHIVKTKNYLSEYFFVRVKHGGPHNMIFADDSGFLFKRREKQNRVDTYIVS